MSGRARLPLHGYNHRPGGSDPIPGLGEVISPGGSWEDRVRAAGTLTAWWRLGDNFTPASSVAGAAVDSAAYDASSPRNLNYAQTSHPATPNAAGAPALAAAEDGAIQFADPSDAYLVQTTGAFAGYDAPWDVTVFGSGSDQLRSVSCWIKTPASFGYKRPILGRWNMDGSGSANVGWVLDLDEDTLRFQVVLDVTHTITGPTLAADTWYHVAVTYEPPANTWRLYVNGALESGLTDSHGFYSEPSGAVFRIGMGGYDSGLGSETLYFHGGTVDEVALYNTTLSGDAIADLAAGVTIADGFVWTATGGTPSWQPPTVEVDGTRYEELLLGTNLTGTPSGDVLTIDAAGGSSFDPSTATSWWFPLFDSDGTAVLDSDGNVIPTLIAI